jgi:hypothetical protein
MTVGEVGEELQVVTRVVADEHPADIRVELGQPVEGGPLAGQPEAEQPPRTNVWPDISAVPAG